MSPVPRTVCRPTVEPAGKTLCDLREGCLRTIGGRLSYHEPFRRGSALHRGHRPSPARTGACSWGIHRHLCLVTIVDPARPETGPSVTRRRQARIPIRSGLPSVGQPVLCLLRTRQARPDCGCVLMEPVSLCCWGGAEEG